MRKLLSPIAVAEQTAPGNPDSGFVVIYAKTDHLLYAKDSTGLERLLKKAPTQQVLTVGSGTYTTPTGCLAILVELVGAGAGGGGVTGSAANCAAAAGGGAGGYVRKLIAAPASTYAYVVGAKGAKGASGNNAGSAGADTTFGSGGSLLTGSGGFGGLAMAFGNVVAVVRGVIGGGATGGDLNCNGGASQGGTVLSGSVGLSGNGGSSYFAGGGRGTAAQGAGNDAGATAYGAGGGGGFSTSANQTGGDGAPGIIIVTEYY